MPITQTRMMNVLAGWQSAIALIQDWQRDTKDFYDEALKTGDWELYANRMHSTLLKTQIPNLELFTAEKVHFKKSQYRNNYMQRRAAKQRGKPGQGERYAADSIIPHQDFGAQQLQPPQFVKSEPGGATPADIGQIDNIIKSIKPPDPDTMAQALKDAKPEDIF